MKPLILSILTTFFIHSLLAENVNIPDENFKKNLLENLDVNTNEDEEIQVSEALAFNGKIDISSQAISDLTGIESFKNLTTLWCANNLLTDIDLSKNDSLDELWCAANKFTTIDLSHNLKLRKLTCQNNTLLTTLDISHNTELTFLITVGNPIEELDLSNNTKLEFVNCSSTQISNIDLSKNTALTEIICNYTNLSSLDLSKNTELTYVYCTNNDLLSLDVSNNVKLIELQCNNNPSLEQVCINPMHNTTNWTKDNEATFNDQCHPLGTDDDLISNEKHILDIFSTSGERVNLNHLGVLILLYDDGSRKKIVIDY